MRTHRAKVLGRRQLSANLVTITLGGLEGYCSTGVPDEYIRVVLAPEGAELALPEITDDWTITYPDGAAEPAMRVYTISDFRVVDGAAQIDLDVALHDVGIGSQWARTCRPGDEVGVLEPHGLYAAPAGVAWQLLVSDITGLPALARILRGLEPGQRVEAEVVLTDPADEIALPSPADVSVRWTIVERETDICDALTRAVTSRELPVDGEPRYVWLAGEARSSRAVRRHLRRELAWPQSDFYTCGYWQIDAAKWDARYKEVADEVTRAAAAVAERLGDDQGAYLDALDDIYDRAGL